MQPVMYWQNFRIWTEIREDLTVYWNRFRKQEAPAEHGSADRSTRVLKRTWPLTSVDELLVSQEDQPQTHHSTRQISREKGLTQSSVVGIIHHDLSLKFLKYLKSHCVRELTAANIVSFSYINLSQGSVATQLRCGGSFSDHFIAYFLLSVPVKEFGKSVSIWTIVCCLVFIGPRCTTIKVKLLLVLCIWLTLYRVNVSWARCPERICALL